VVVEKGATSEHISLFVRVGHSILLLNSGELQYEGAFGATLAVGPLRLVGGPALLAPVAVQHINAVAIWVESLRPLRNELDVVRAEERVEVLP
jgi:hypothetical protein